MSKRLRRVFDNKGIWGNTIVTDKVHKEKEMTAGLDIHGFLPTLPEKDDLYACNMQSGRVALFQFTEVEPCGDPPDMFFGKVVPIGYTEDVSLSDFEDLRTFGNNADRKRRAEAVERGDLTPGEATRLV